MKVSIIGLGNVGSSILENALKMDIQIDQVYNRSTQRLKAFADADVRLVSDLGAIERGSDIYLLCISDDHIESVAHSLKNLIGQDALIAHCSGVQSSTILRGLTTRPAVCYPLQSFNENASPLINEVPFFVTAESEADELILCEFIAKLGGLSFLISNQQKADLHLAAVFLNNFGNHMLKISADILKASDLPTEYLMPLFKKTFRQDNFAHAGDRQTGPAARNDMQTIRKHLALLSDNPALAELYLQLSKSINPSITDL